MGWGGGGPEGPTTREVKLDSRFVTCSGELVLMIKQKKDHKWSSFGMEDTMCTILNILLLRSL